MNGYLNKQLFANKLAMWTFRYGKVRYLRYALLYSQFVSFSPFLTNTHFYESNLIIIDKTAVKKSLGLTEEQNHNLYIKWNRKSPYCLFEETINKVLRSTLCI